jgi:glucose 1-dehydrogenase
VSASASIRDSPSRLDPALGDLGVLLEPTSVVAKAWEHAERIGRRAWFEPKVALITGAGPIGLVAAMLARQCGLETHVVDLVTEGAKPQLVADLGAHYHAGAVAEVGVEPDVVIECTGVGQVVIDAARNAAPGAVVARTGISHSARAVEAHPDEMNKALVLGNKAVFGSVNAARRHYDQAADALARADATWLGRIITRRVPPEAWPAALEKRPDDIKVAVDMGASQ